MDNQQITPTPLVQSQPPKQMSPMRSIEKRSSNVMPAIVIALAILAVGFLQVFVVSSSSAKQQKTLEAIQDKISTGSTSGDMIAKAYEDSVDKSKYQAVFIKGGQVYFGKVTKMNAAVLELEDIYYLRTQQEVQGNTSTPGSDVSLAKLGSELHGPQDKMIITMSDISFIENLKSDGEVSKAISEFKESL